MAAIFEPLQQGKNFPAIGIAAEIPDRLTAGGREEL